MDFLSRLIGGGASTPNRKSSANNPQHRLQRFRKTYNQALQAFNKTTLVRSDPAAVDAIRLAFNKLTTLLHDDSRAPAPHLCLSFAASPQVFTAIASIASRLNNDDVVREAVAIYSALVDSDEENLLGNESFAKELMSFVETLMEGSSRVGRQAEGEILELAFGIAAKIRLEPDLLPVWFTPNHDASDDAVFGKAEALPAGDKKAFPLCHQFVGHVYHEGRAGDFARTGLLYIFETASHYNGLENWIVHSELPTLMATGLGALYSQLSRKLAIAHPDDRLPLILALSDNDHHPLAEDADSFYAEGLQERLKTFMSNLVFWQDILEHCRSLEIKHTLIDHFQVFFLQQILYPSLLESSDADGGSSVAVLTYLWRILDSVDHPDLIHLILNYLLALSDPLEQPPSAAAANESAERRRKSLLTLSRSTGDSEQLTPTFFNLVDLINGSVRSSNTETVTAALRLVTVILSKHHQHAIKSLVRSIPFRPSSLTRSIGSLRRDLEAYLSAAQAIGGEEGMDESYQNCLKDGLAMVETHVCSATKLGLVASNVADGRRRGSILDSTSDLHDHLLLNDDPLIQALLTRLETFFTNDIETNLELTQVISHLASCPYTRLEGWLVAETSRRKQQSRKPSMTLEESLASLPELDSTEDAKEPSEEERIAALKSATREDTTADEEPPRMLQILHSLQQQIATVKSTILDMEAFIKGRKRAFQGATEIENELRTAAPSILSPRLSRSTSRTSSRARNGGIETPTKPKAPTPQTQRGRPLPTHLASKKAGLQSPRVSSPAQTAPGRRPLSPTPSTPARALSPLKASFTPADLNGAADEPANSSRRPSATPAKSGADDLEEEEEEEIFERKIRFPLANSTEDKNNEEKTERQTGAGPDAARTEENGPDPEESREATLNHVLTNVIILQEFILEMAALIHVRSSLLEGEVKFA